MAMDKNFALRFAEANEGFGRAIAISNEVQAAYYLGVLAGMLATVLPEPESRTLTSVTGMSADAINRAIQPVLGRAHEILREANRG